MRTLLRTIALLIVLVFITATVTPLFAQKWTPYKMYQPPTKKHVVVLVQLTTPENARHLCGGAIGCFRQVLDVNGKDLEIPQIIVPSPQDFNDYNGLVILGHEFLHALGANHD